MASLKKRGEVYYAQYYVSGKQKRVCLDTTSLQIAKEKIRTIESAFHRGDEMPLPTKTPISKAVTDYIEYMRIRKTAKSVERDNYYLRETFGQICPALTLKNPKISQKSPKRNYRDQPTYIEANFIEQITTADISSFIASRVRRKALAPKTANRFREILTRLFNWSMDQNGLRLPGDKNPAAKVERYREKAPEISFLKLEQIEEQLNALKQHPVMQTMVAVYIYAGLRREELCWLTLDDIDFNAGTYGMIRVRAKTVNGQFWEPKTKVNRTVPISSKLREYLDRYVPKKIEGNWYFSTAHSNRWDADNVSRYLKRINDKAYLKWNCLEFRHTFGSQLAMKGESLYKISNLMGNSPEICRKHYAALIPEAMVNSVEF